MTSFDWWADLVRAHSGGERFLCQVCFEGFPMEQAWADGTGQRWDVCTTCQPQEVTPPPPVGD